MKVGFFQIVYDYLMTTKCNVFDEIELCLILLDKLFEITSSDQFKNLYSLECIETLTYSENLKISETAK